MKLKKIGPWGASLAFPLGSTTESLQRVPKREFKNKKLAKVFDLKAKIGHKFMLSLLQRVDFV